MRILFRTHRSVSILEIVPSFQAFEDAGRIGTSGLSKEQVGHCPLFYRNESEPPLKKGRKVCRMNRIQVFWSKADLWKNWSEQNPGAAVPTPQKTFWRPDDNDSFLNM